MKSANCVFNDKKIHDTGKKRWGHVRVGWISLRIDRSRGAILAPLSPAKGTRCNSPPDYRFPAGISFSIAMVIEKHSMNRQFAQAGPSKCCRDVMLLYLFPRLLLNVDAVSGLRTGGGCLRNLSEENQMGLAIFQTLSLSGASFRRPVKQRLVNFGKPCG
ncbi:hypothetical protein Nepgr_014476 [Nepenthes gracilis]|uniref:Uncharacterized protein n=1 Tax=Nepenthes gracilis TaxID=150966 RepID=A0AAD3SJ75_NEPGR|nr:hypothetical protein Nepgr_014476 [Nepenthes gracilis]